MRLLYPADGAARDARYTRYVCEGALLRTQTSALVPPLARERAPDGHRRGRAARVPGPRLPPRHHRPAARGRAASARPVAPHARRARATSTTMIARSSLPRCPAGTLALTPGAHPYTVGGTADRRRSDAAAWIEIGECGARASRRCSRAPASTCRGEASRWASASTALLMLRKGIDDIRLLRVDRPARRAQMLDLAPYRPVSASAAGAARLVHRRGPRAHRRGARRSRAREALGEDAAVVEELSDSRGDAGGVVAATRARALQIEDHQKNVLLRLMLRPLSEP